VKSHLEIPFKWPEWLSNPVEHLGAQAGVLGLTKSILKKRSWHARSQAVYGKWYSMRPSISGTFQLNPPNRTRTDRLAQFRRAQRSRDASAVGEPHLLWVAPEPDTCSERLTHFASEPVSIPMMRWPGGILAWLWLYGMNMRGGQSYRRPGQNMN